MGESARTKLFSARIWKCWNDPFPPHRVMDNVYYVGTKELASFLITTPEGDILMNSDYESSVPVIQASVKELGFDFKDIKILIATPFAVFTGDGAF